MNRTLQIRLLTMVLLASTCTVSNNRIYSHDKAAGEENQVGYR